MPYQATVYRAFIASPSDVEEERKIIREVINEWNVSHQFDRKTIIEPVGWDTHSFPSLGGTAQDVINSQVLEDADLLIGVFWTRIGTETESHISGTVEEIEKLRAEKKPVMIYFSDQPAHPASVNHEQYTRLQEFKTALFKIGLVANYSNIEGFRNQFRMQLTAQLNKLIKSQEPDDDLVEVFESALSSRPTISDEAGQLLHEIAKNGGKIHMLPVLGGTHFQLGGRVLDGSTPRLVAKWKGMIGDLGNANFLSPVGYKGDSFEVTNDGYGYLESKGLLFD